MPQYSISASPEDALDDTVVCPASNGEPGVEVERWANYDGGVYTERIDLRILRRTWQSYRVAKCVDRKRINLDEVYIQSVGLVYRLSSALLYVFFELVLGRRTDIKFYCDLRH